MATVLSKIPVHLQREAAAARNADDDKRRHCGAQPAFPMLSLANLSYSRDAERVRNAFGEFESILTGVSMEVWLLSDIAEVFC
jgi:hypothetical protein